MATRKSATAGMSLIKRGWNEIPEIMCCLGIIGFSSVLLGIGSARHLHNSEIRHQYRYNYEVVRTCDVDPNKEIYN